MQSLRAMLDGPDVIVAPGAFRRAALDDRRGMSARAQAGRGAPLAGAQLAQAAADRRWPCGH